MLIAHRLSTVRNADSIVVLDGGRVVEQVRTHGLARPRSYRPARVRLSGGTLGAYAVPCRGMAWYGMAPRGSLWPQQCGSAPMAVWVWVRARKARSSGRE